MTAGWERVRRGLGWRRGHRLRAEGREALDCYTAELRELLGGQLDQ